jgi:hypothetical protein
MNLMKAINNLFRLLSGSEYQGEIDIDILNFNKLIQMKLMKFILRTLEKY